MTLRLCKVATLLLAILLVHGARATSASLEKDAQAEGQGTLNLDAVNQLLDLMDTLVSKNPTYQSFVNWSKSVDYRKPADSAKVLAQKNAEDPQIHKMVDALLNTEAYRLYYAQFRNVNPSIHRDIIYSLPYTAIRSPAGIADNLQELCSNRDSVRKWAQDVISKISLARCNAIAWEWLPKGDYTTPTIYCIYDGNGSAFARAGAVCLDLYGLVLWMRPAATRFVGLSEISVDDMERVIAHEFVHVYSAQISRPTPGPSSTWQEKMIARITTGLISEGIAQQCNPPEGLKAELWNDTSVIAFWIKELNEKLTALKAGNGNRDETYQWWSSTYQQMPESLLISYLAGRYPNDDQRKLRSQHIADRPDLEHTLGLWMVSRIYGNGNQKDKVLQLLSEPDKLIPFYNESMKAAPECLKLNL